MVYKIIIFLIINFAALAIGGIFTSKGVTSEWYSNLNKAPWTPPGWVFGAAWFSIMVFFSVYMAQLWGSNENHNLIVWLFCIQCFLNVIWNPVFFHYHFVWIGLIIISLLTLLIGFLFFYYFFSLKNISFFVLPYFIWLLIATSLNAFIAFKN